MGKQHLIETSQWIQWIYGGSSNHFGLRKKMNPASSIFGPKYWQFWLHRDPRKLDAKRGVRSVAIKFDSKISFNLCLHNIAIGNGHLVR